MPVADIKNTVHQQRVSTAERASLLAQNTMHIAPRPVMPISRYVLLSGAASLASFQALWWLLTISGDEAPWLASCVAAGMTILACIVAREIRVRHYGSRAALAYRHETLHPNSNYQSKKRLGYTATLTAATTAIRRLERRLREIERNGVSAEAHFEAYRLCQQYLMSAEETLPTLGVGTEVRAAVRAGQERVQLLKKRHLLLWARKESQAMILQAQQRVRFEDKIETAQTAAAAIDEALKAYPNEAELHESARAVREYIASVNVARWVSLAERAVFKGNIAEAADFYRDALFDLSRANISEEVREEAAERLLNQLRLLQAHLATNDNAPPNTHAPDGTEKLRP